MSFGGFASDSVTYLRYLGDDAEKNYEASYEKYELSGVLVREKFGFTPENELINETVIYFLINESVCKNGKGEKTDIPRPKNGDICVLHPGEPDETRLRIAELGYFIGEGAGRIPHLRLKLN